MDPETSAAHGRWLDTGDSQCPGRTAPEPVTSPCSAAETGVRQTKPHR